MKCPLWYYFLQKCRPFLLRLPRVYCLTNSNVIVTLALRRMRWRQMEIGYRKTTKRDRHIMAAISRNRSSNTPMIQCLLMGREMFSYNAYFMSNHWTSFNLGIPEIQCNLAYHFFIDQKGRLGGQYAVFVQSLGPWLWHLAHCIADCTTVCYISTFPYERD